MIDDFPSIPYPVDKASQVLPAFQDGRPVHSLRVAHRSIRVPGSVGNYLEQLAQNARSASLVQPVVPQSSDNGDSDWSFQPPSSSGSSRLPGGPKFIVILFIFVWLKSAKTSQVLCRRN